MSKDEGVKFLRGKMVSVARLIPRDETSNNKEHASDSGITRTDSVVKTSKLNSDRDDMNDALPTFHPDVNARKADTSKSQGPPNAFHLFANEHQNEFFTHYEDDTSQQINNSRLRDAWKNLHPFMKEHYLEKAKENEREHKKVYSSDQFNTNTTLRKRKSYSGKRKMGPSSTLYRNMKATGMQKQHSFLQNITNTLPQPIRQTRVMPHPLPGVNCLSVVPPLPTYQVQTSSLATPQNENILPAPIVVQPFSGFLQPQTHFYQPQQYAYPVQNVVPNGSFTTVISQPMSSYQAKGDNTLKITPRTPPPVIRYDSCSTRFHSGSSTNIHQPPAQYSSWVTQDKSPTSYDVSGMPTLQQYDHVGLPISPPAQKPILHHQWSSTCDGYNRQYDSSNTMSNNQFGIQHNEDARLPYQQQQYQYMYSTPASVGQNEDMKNVDQLRSDHYSSTDQSYPTDFLDISEDHVKEEVPTKAADKSTCDYVGDALRTLSDTSLVPFDISEIVDVDECVTKSEEKHPSCSCSHDITLDMSVNESLHSSTDNQEPIMTLTTDEEIKVYRVNS